MSETNELRSLHAIPAVGWHNTAAQKRPGTLRPLPLPIHPEVPSIPGGIPGSIGTRTGIIPGRSPVEPLPLFTVAPHVALPATRGSNGAEHPVYSIPTTEIGVRTGVIIPGRSGIAPGAPHATRPHQTPIHVSRPIPR